MRLGWILMILCIWTSSNAQMAVTDPANTAVNKANLVKNSAILQKAIVTLKTLDKMKNTAEDMKENIEVVTNTIATGKQIINIKNKIEDISRIYERNVNKVVNNDNFSNPQKEYLVWMFTSVLADSLSDLDDGIMVSSSGSYKMNDAERLTFLDKLENSMNHNYQLLLYMSRKLNKSINTANRMTRSNSILKSANNSFDQ